jgi:multidrug resistance efflux pump
MKRLAKLIVTAVVLAAGAAGVYELWNYYMLSPWTRDARIRADVVTIAPDVSGFVSELRVKDNQFVHKGDVLLVLDQERYKLALGTADANVAAQKAIMEMRKSQWDRRSKLTNLAISDEAKEDAHHIATSTGASYQQALADRATAALNLERTVIRAPVNGFVTNLTLVVGQYAAVGTKVVALIDSDSYRVEGYFEETKIPSLKMGDKVDMYLMSGGEPLRGHVAGISRGITDRDNPSGPELLATVNPTFEWVRLAQRIPVRIHIDTVTDGVQISSGMTCTVVVAEAPRTSAMAPLIKHAWAALSGKAFAANRS